MAEIEATHEKTRSEIAEYLREFADELDTGVSGATGTADRSPDIGADDDPERVTDTTRREKLTVLAGNQSATINPPETLAFDVAVDTDSGLLDDGEHTTTFTLRWDEEHVEADDELDVQ